MFEFPYMQLPGGILRPMIAVVIEGPSGRRLLDGLLDTGSDRTIFPQREARGLLTFLCTKLRTQPRLSQATLEQAVTTNATISEPVRRRALEWAPAFWKASDK